MALPMEALFRQPCEKHKAAAKVTKSQEPLSLFTTAFIAAWYPKG